MFSPERGAEGCCATVAITTCFQLPFQSKHRSYLRPPGGGAVAMAPLATPLSLSLPLRMRFVLPLGRLLALRFKGANNESCASALRTHSAYLDVIRSRPCAEGLGSISPVPSLLLTRADAQPRRRGRRRELRVCLRSPRVTGGGGWRGREKSPGSLCLPLFFLCGASLVSRHLWCRWAPGAPGLFLPRVRWSSVGP